VEGAAAIAGATRMTRRTQPAGSKIETKPRDRAALFGTVPFGVALARFRRTIGSM
jgi:hypothetical protein